MKPKQIMHNQYYYVLHIVIYLPILNIKVDAIRVKNNYLPKTDIIEKCSTIHINKSTNTPSV